MKHQLDFEKPILELQRKLEELKKHPENNAMGIKFEEEIAIIEKKIGETKRQIFRPTQPLGPDQNCAPSQTPVRTRLCCLHIHGFLRTARRPTVCR